MNSFLSDVRHEFRRHKDLADRAMIALDDETFFRRPSDVVNSVALIVKHLAGNLSSRWTEFLTSDGEKPGRARDQEFVIGPQDTRRALLQAWEAGWTALFGTLEALTEGDLEKLVAIRGEPQTVEQALLRGLSHVAYHTGQILYLVRLWHPDSAWQTIAPGKSGQHRPSYRNQ